MDTGYSIPRQRIDWQRKLLGAAQDRLAVAQRLEDIIEIVRATARATMSADGVTFVLREGEQCHYVEEDAIGPLWKGQKFPMGSCISGWAMLHGKTAVIGDIFADDRIPHDVYRKTFVRSLVMTPVKGGTTIAAIGAYWGERREFNGDEADMLETFAASVGEAMNRTKAA